MNMTNEAVARANDAMAAMRAQRDAALEACLARDIELGAARRAVERLEKRISELEATKVSEECT